MRRQLSHAHIPTCLNLMLCVSSSLNSSSGWCFCSFFSELLLKNSMLFLHTHTSHRITSHLITSHHITSYHITSHYITSHCITAISHHITSHCIIPHHITLHHITSHHITSHHITLHHTTSHHITSHHITSHHTASHHTPVYTCNFFLLMQFLSSSDSDVSVTLPQSECGYILSFITLTKY